jgi:hypothetical protein
VTGASVKLERRYRRLLAFYPPGYRAANAEEMVAVAMSSARPGQRWPDPGESCSLVAGGIRTSLRGIARAGRDPAWQDAGAAVTFLGPVLLAVSAAQPQAFEIGTFAFSPALMISVFVWALLAITAAAGWRRLTAAGTAAALVVTLYANGTGGQWVMVTAWWQFVAAVAVMAASVLALSTRHRVFSWPALTAVAVSAALLVTGTVVTTRPWQHEPLPGMLIPGLRFRRPAPSTWQALSDWLSRETGQVILAGQVLVAAAMLIAICQLTPAVRRRATIVMLPALATMLMVREAYATFLDSSQQFEPTAQLTIPRWIALAAVPLTTLAAGSAWLSWRERRLRRSHRTAQPAPPAAAPPAGRDQ